MTVDFLTGTRIAWIFGLDSKKKNPFVRQQEQQQQQQQHATAEASDAVASPAENPASPVARAVARPVRFNRKSLLKALWIVAGISALVVPIIIRNVKINKHQNYSWGKVANQNNNYQQYMQQQWYRNGQQGYQPQGRQFYDVSGCTWWKFKCTPVYIDETGKRVSEYEMRQEMYRQQQRQYEEQRNQQYQYQNQYQQRNKYQQVNQYPIYSKQGSTVGLKFVYGVQFILFLGTLALGYTTIHKDQNAWFISQILIGWIGVSALTMILLKTIAIQSQVQQLSGYYGQFSVLLFMTNAAFFIFSVTFTGYFMKMHSTKSSSASENKGDYVEAPGSKTSSIV